MSDCPPAVRDSSPEQRHTESGTAEESAGSDTQDRPPATPAPTPPAAGETVRRIQSAVLGIALVWLTVQWWLLSTARPRPLPWERNGRAVPVFQIDINRADWIDWIQLDGIGETMAHRIVADREHNGPFSRIDDLMRVDGIGPATLARIRDHLTVDSRSSLPKTPLESAGN